MSQEEIASLSTVHSANLVRHGRIVTSHAKESHRSIPMYADNALSEPLTHSVQTPCKRLRKESPEGEGAGFQSTVESSQCEIDDEARKGAPCQQNSIGVGTTAVRSQRGIDADLPMSSRAGSVSLQSSKAVGATVARSQYDIDKDLGGGWWGGADAATYISHSECHSTQHGNAKKTYDTTSTSVATSDCMHYAPAAANSKLKLPGGLEEQCMEPMHGASLNSDDVRQDTASCAELRSQSATVADVRTECMRCGPVDTAAHACTCMHADRACSCTGGADEGCKGHSSEKSLFPEASKHAPATCTAEHSQDPPEASCGENFPKRAKGPPILWGNNVVNKNSSTTTTANTRAAKPAHRDLVSVSTQSKSAPKPPIECGSSMLTAESRDRLVQPSASDVQPSRGGRSPHPGISSPPSADATEALVPPARGQSQIPPQELRGHALKAARMHSQALFKAQAQGQGRGGGRGRGCMKLSVGTFVVHDTASRSQVESNRELAWRPEIEAVAASKSCRDRALESNALHASHACAMEAAVSLGVSTPKDTADMHAVHASNHPTNEAAGAVGDCSNVNSMHDDHAQDHRVNSKLASCVSSRTIRYKQNAGGCGEGVSAELGDESTHMSSVHATKADDVNAAVNRNSKVNARSHSASPHCMKPMHATDRGASNAAAQMSMHGSGGGAKSVVGNTRRSRSALRKPAPWVRRSAATCMNGKHAGAAPAAATGTPATAAGRGRGRGRESQSPARMGSMHAAHTLYHAGNRTKDSNIDVPNQNMLKMHAELKDCERECPVDTVSGPRATKKEEHGGDELSCTKGDAGNTGRSSHQRRQLLLESIFAVTGTTANANEQS